MAITPSPNHTPPTFHIRPATDKDVPAIVDIGRRVFSASFAHTMTSLDLVTYLDETYTPKHVLRNLGDAAQTWFVATTTDVQSTLAGFAVLRRGASEPVVDPYPKPIELLRMYVDSPFHGTGAARMLMEAGIEHARREGYQTLWLGVYEENAKAKRFYDKFGFRHVGAHDFVTGETVTTDLLMVKSLV